mgnify:FL=1
MNVMCNISKVTVDMNNRIGTMITPPMNYPDMLRTIQLFTSIDPKIEEIQVFEGDSLDIVYFKDHQNADGEWVSKRMK